MVTRCKSLIYKYDATLGRQINTNDVLTLLQATAKTQIYVQISIVMKNS